MATGFVDLAALPFTLTGLLEPEQAVGSTAWLTSKGLLPPPQEGIIPETLEMVSGSLSPGGATSTGLLALGAVAGSKGRKPIGETIRTVQDEAMEVAQRNAALPVEQGGLGLPANNTPMDRARAMGFDVDNPLYHGTNADITAFRLGVESPGHTVGAQPSQSVFFTPNPENASAWALAARERDDPFIRNLWAVVNDRKASAEAKKNAKELLKRHNDAISGKAVYPAVIRPGEVMRYDAGNRYYYDLPSSRQPDALVQRSQKKGLDTVVIENMYDPPVRGWGGPWNAPQVSVNDPANIRSRFAAFDPKRSSESDILASILAGLGLGGLLTLSEEEDRF